MYFVTLVFIRTLCTALEAFDMSGLRNPFPH